nr:chloramphenicol phosphotransferase CPT family protein [Streptomyces sp. YIM 132580]
MALAGAEITLGAGVLTWLLHLTGWGKPSGPRPESEWPWRYGTSPPGRGTWAAWPDAGVTATARAGARVIVDDVFLGGPASQEAWRKALRGLNVLWVGVHCEGAVAEARETARGDRPRGMAAAQAETVHRGVAYDLEVDTTHTESLTVARTIALHVT